MSISARVDNKLRIRNMSRLNKALRPIHNNAPEPSFLARSGSLGVPERTAIVCIPVGGLIVLGGMPGGSAGDFDIFLVGYFG